MGGDIEARGGAAVGSAGIPSGSSGKAGTGAAEREIAAWKADSTSRGIS